MRAVVCLAVAVLSGCDCGGGDDTSDTPDATGCGFHPGETVCGAACCTSGQRCIDLVCCPDPLQCGSSCCSVDRPCVDGACSDCPTGLCNGMCCAEDYGCADTGCCPSAQTCEGTCCPDGTVCEVGTCVPACGPRDERCGPQGEPECCLGEDICRWERCLTPGPPCHDTPECEDGELCDPARLRCIPLPDGGLPPDAGPPTDAGPPEDGAPDASA